MKIGWGELISLHDNKRRIPGPEYSMSEVETPPPHISEKHHGLVDSINNNNNNNKNKYVWIISYIMDYST